MSDNIQDWLIGIDEASRLLGFKKRYLYKLTSFGLIPFLKPFGKKIYFDKRQLEDFILNGNKINNQVVVKKSIEYMCQTKKSY